MADELIGILLNELERRKQKGESAISLDLFQQWLVSIPAAAERDRNFEIWKASAPLQHASRMENFKSALEAGQTALKTLITINGGAAAALLAFLSNLLSKAPNPALQASIGKAMAVFVAGVACGGVATAARYLTQYTANVSSNQHTDPSKPPPYKKTFILFNGTSILSGLASLSAFCIGGWLAYKALLP